MNNSVRLINALRNGPGVRSTAQKGLLLVRNVGGPAAAHGPGIPFPPGPRQLQQLRNWLGSATIFGGVGFGLLCYFSDWKVICSFIPFYNGKFKEE